MGRLGDGKPRIQSEFPCVMLQGKIWTAPGHLLYFSCNWDPLGLFAAGALFGVGNHKIWVEGPILRQHQCIDGTSFSENGPKSPPMSRKRPPFDSRRHTSWAHFPATRCSPSEASFLGRLRAAETKRASQKTM